MRAVCIFFATSIVILYKGLEHPQIFVYAGDSGTNSLWIWWAVCNKFLTYQHVHYCAMIFFIIE